MRTDDAPLRATPSSGGAQKGLLRLTQLGRAGVRDQRDPRRELPLACTKRSDLIPIDLRLGDGGAQREPISTGGAEVVRNDVRLRRLRQPLDDRVLRTAQPRERAGVDDGAYARRQLGEQSLDQVTGMRSSRP